MGWTRRLLAIVLGVALLGAACSSDDESTESDSDETEATTDDGSASAADDGDADTNDGGESEADEGDTDDGEADEESDTAEGGATDEEAAPATDGAIPVDLGEWFIEFDGDLAAGSLTFAVENVGENPHALAIVRGDRYEDLPQLDNGAVDTEAMGDDFLGTTDNFETGEGGEITFDLEAGNYVFFCPVQFGPNSHAAAGQVLSVTVGG